MAADGDETNSRVTTREFYEMQLKMRDDINKGFAEASKERAEVKQTIAPMSKQLETVCDTAKQNQDDITSIKRQSNRLDAGVLVISTVWTGLITWLSTNK